ncbi:MULTISPECIES: FtsH protease activity modulator HflK [Methylosinus]|uniref:Protein HflK n=1 Tax=Methylosinus sporium TaxID=428 RepID=A0A2U1SQN4_METSR|nr:MULTISPECIES: FtsH protease activity modulator HflK [Methylosinus]MBU3887789.1 FtsH protease activity modulator HflK [Methylosinus sp. KRF6]PWB93919.1 FtsH protease activity modulator HflK [Methylosinus sporium]TRL30880.1 FtsH protease activity modulator HflK [Methylosinus sporium]
MPWSSQGGGPRKPNDNGPWGQGPWGGGPSGGGAPPDLEELLRRGQDSLRQMLPSGLGGRGVAILALLTVLAWLASGFYTVGPNEVGLNLLFGKYRGKTQAGLNYNLPSPIGTVIKLAVTDRNAVDIGFREQPTTRRGPLAPEAPEESLMLTGDENIADVKFRVFWQIDPAHPEDYAFNVANPPATVKAVAESAMREIVGQSQIQKILTADRKLIEPASQQLMQKVLDDYHSGVLVLQVLLLSVDPPASVIAAFRDVTAAQQDLQRLGNEAEAYANRVVPEARGASARILQEAEAYREQIVAEAQGQASRFDQIYDQYKKAPSVTRQRLYLETMERVLGGAEKVIIDEAPAGVSGGGSVVPYLPLPGFSSTQGGRK